MRSRYLRWAWAWYCFASGVLWRAWVHCLHSLCSPSLRREFFAKAVIGNASLHPGQRLSGFCLGSFAGFRGRWMVTAFFVGCMAVSGFVVFIKEFGMTFNGVVGPSGLIERISRTGLRCLRGVSPRFSGFGGWLWGFSNAKGMGDRVNDGWNLGEKISLGEIRAGIEPSSYYYPFANGFQDCLGRCK